MRTLSQVMRVILLLAPLTNFAGHVRGDDILTTTAELNRCLTAVRVAFTKRGAVVNTASKLASAWGNDGPRRVGNDR